MSTPLAHGGELPMQIGPRPSGGEGTIVPKIKEIWCLCGRTKANDSSISSIAHMHRPGRTTAHGEGWLLLIQVQHITDRHALEFTKGDAGGPQDRRSLDRNGA